MAVFDSWEADRISVTKGAIVVAAVKEKVGDEEKWRIEAPDKPEADSSKVEAFIRKLEGLEAVELIDTPKDLAEYGLDKPEAKMNVRVKDGENKTREITILVGREDKEKNLVVVKNTELELSFQGGLCLSAGPAQGSQGLEGRGQARAGRRKGRGEEMISA